MEQKKFNLGDTVTWTSQSGGHFKTKTGEIIAVIPAGSVPSKGIRGTVKGRDHESYVVQVGYRIYWPKVVYLGLAEEDETPAPIKADRYDVLESADLSAGA